jgi:methylenetetrahydrofolate--tRNA-(uracil-5-)-methyltransferase
MTSALVIGGGLSGCEAAWQIARAGIAVDLYEMRPSRSTPAHRTGLLGELVCSNSLKSDDGHTASGLLKRELRALGSIVLQAADRTAVPAGSALAVDRDRFAEEITERLQRHPLVRIVTREVTRLPVGGPLVVASGPLTSEALAGDLAARLGQENLFFYDAIAPLIEADSLDKSMIFTASRYGKGAPAYLNCPFNRQQYQRFYEQLVGAETAPLHDFEKDLFFQACLPVEEMARRGPRTLLFGPLRPVGLIDPRTGKRPWAVVQLRRDNAGGSIYNMVGCQTRLRQPEQRRVFRLIPGLERARFLRYGSVHRNTYVCAPRLLDVSLNVRRLPELFLAGQLTGAEGYIEAVATGLIAGLNAVRRIQDRPPLVPPETTLLGSLCRYLATADAAHFQPMNVNFGILPPPAEPIRGRRDRRRWMARRALSDLDLWLRKEGQQRRGEPGAITEEISGLTGSGTELLREHGQGL